MFTTFIGVIILVCISVRWGQIHRTQNKAFESEQYSDTHHVMQPPPLPSSRTLSPPGKETLNPLCSLPGAAVAKYYKLGWLKTSLGLLNQCVFMTGLPLRLCFWLEDNYSIVMVFATHQYASVTGTDVSPPSWIPSHLPPHPTPPGCHRALALGALRHTSNSHWVFYVW